jgi:hypothetical protein
MEICRLGPQLSGRFERVDIIHLSDRYCRLRTRWEFEHFRIGASMALVPQERHDRSRAGVAVADEPLVVRLGCEYRDERSV